MNLVRPSKDYFCWTRCHACGKFYPIDCIWADLDDVVGTYYCDKDAAKLRRGPQKKDYPARNEG